MYGPAEELCDLLFVPISQETGLHKVHPTWAGIFVLAALTFLFPGVHLVLLDSDCVPVTLFEIIADLWKEVSFLRNRTTEHPVPAAQGSDEVHHCSVESAPKAPKLGGKELRRTEVGQGILLVTEHNAEIIAGFIVVFGSRQAAPLDDARWNMLSFGTKDATPESLLQIEADCLEQLYWAKVKDLY